MLLKHAAETLVSGSNMAMMAGPDEGNSEHCDTLENCGMQTHRSHDIGAVTLTFGMPSYCAVARVSVHHVLESGLGWLSHCEPCSSPSLHHSTPTLRIPAPPGFFLRHLVHTCSSQGRSAPGPCTASEALVVTLEPMIRTMLYYDLVLYRAPLIEEREVKRCREAFSLTSSS